MGGGDFLVAGEAAEMYGLMPQLLSGDPEILSSPVGRKWYASLMSGDFDKIFATAMEIVGSLSGDVPPIKNETAVRNAWQAYTALAEKYNDPGRFTAIIGFEWTAVVPVVCRKCDPPPTSRLRLQFRQSPARAEHQRHLPGSGIATGATSRKTLSLQAGHPVDVW